MLSVVVWGARGAPDSLNIKIFQRISMISFVERVGGAEGAIIIGKEYKSMQFHDFFGGAGGAG